LERLFGFVDGADESPLAGPIDIELRVRPGSVWRITGTVGAGQGDFYEVRFSNVRVPVDAEWHPRSGRVRMQVPTVNASLAGGRVSGRLTAERTVGWTIDGAFRFYRVDVVTLVRQLGSESQYGTGRLTGTLTIEGRNMQSINDLRAVLAADLEDTQAGNLPVLGDLRNFVPGAAASGATRFYEGRLEARLMRGVFHVDRLSLSSTQLDVYITGTINLSGRLRLEAVVFTGQGNNPALAQALLTRFAAVASAPVALLASANDFLANRVIHLDIRGTLSRPVIRLRPFETLREEIVRYLLRRAAGAVIGAAGPVPATAAEQSR
jgi:hypothetical protein